MRQQVGQDGGSLDTPYDKRNDGQTKAINKASEGAKKEAETLEKIRENVTVKLGNAGILACE